MGEFKKSWPVTSLEEQREIANLTALENLCNGDRTLQSGLFLGEDFRNPKEGDLVLKDGVFEQYSQDGKWLKKAEYRFFETLTEALLATNIAEGDTVFVNERSAGKKGGGMWIASTVEKHPENLFDQVNVTGTPGITLRLIKSENSTVEQYGVDGENDSDSFKHAFNNGVYKSSGAMIDFEKAVTVTCPGDADIDFTDTVLNFNFSGAGGLTIAGDGHDVSITGGDIAVPAEDYTGIAISVTGANNVIIDGVGSISENLDNAIKVSSSVKTNIKNCVFSKADKAGRCIDIRNLSNVTVEDNYINGFITHIDNTSTNNDVSNVSIDNNSLLNSGDTSVFVRAINYTGGATPTTTKNVTISNNRLENIGKAGIKLEIPNGDECHILDCTVTGNIIRGWGKYVGSGALHYVNAVPENNATISNIVSTGNVVDGRFTDGTTDIAGPSEGHTINGITDVKLSDSVSHTYSAGCTMYASSRLSNSSKYYKCNATSSFNTAQAYTVTSCKDLYDSSEVIDPVVGNCIELNKTRGYKLSGRYVGSQGWGIVESPAGPGGSKTNAGSYVGCDVSNNTLGGIQYAVTDYPRSYESGCKDEGGVRQGNSLTGSQAWNKVKLFDTLADAIGSKLLNVGDIVRISERTTGNGGGADWEVVSTADITLNGFDIVQSTYNASLSFRLIVNGDISIAAFGAISSTSDSTAYINACFARVAAEGVGKAIIPSGEFTAETITMHSNLHIEGLPGSSIRLGAMWYITDLSNVTVNNVDINVRTDRWLITTIVASGSNNIHIRNVNLNGGGGWDGSVQGTTGAQSGFSFSGCTDVSVKNCSMHNFRKQGNGVKIDLCTNSVIENNDITQTGRGGIFIHTNNKNTIVRNNRVSLGVINFTIEDGAIDMYGPNNDNTLIEGNVVSDYGSATRTAIGIRIKGSSNTVCRDNIVYAGKYSLAMINVQERNGVIDKRVSIINNKLIIRDGDTSTYGIRSTQCYQLTIKDNVIHTLSADNSHVQTGIEIRFDAWTANISGNVITGELGGVADVLTGIDLNHAGNAYKNVTIRDNVLNTKSVPISCDLMENFTISGNIVETTYNSAAAINVISCTKGNINSNIITQPTARVGIATCTNVVEFDNNLS